MKSHDGRPISVTASRTLALIRSFIHSLRNGSLQSFSSFYAQFLPRLWIRKTKGTPAIRLGWRLL